MISEPGQGEIWTVSRLVDRLQAVVAQALPPLWIEGEISNYTHAASGHRYFTLKDDRNQLKAAFFRGRARSLRFEPEDGQKVLAFGAVNIYGQRSEYQLIVEQLMPVGAGELELAFKQLHARLEKEGLFAPERKKALPVFPRRIGIVTSPRGAAVRDMLKVLVRRAPHVEIVIAPTLVQGEGAADHVARAVRAFNRAGHVDLIIVGRGGGSLEDLWAFNEEAVVRAVAESRLPIVSGVGHEIDTTLCDLAADLRAPTPSAAAEMAITDRREWQSQVSELSRRLRGEMAMLLDLAARHLGQITQRYGFRKPQDALLAFVQTVDRVGQSLTRLMRTLVLERRRQLVRLGRRTALAQPESWLRAYREAPTGALANLAGGWQTSTAPARERLARLHGALAALSPRSVLDRGYAILEDQEDRIISSVQQVEPGQPIRAVLKDGRLSARVESREASR